MIGCRIEGMVESKITRIIQVQVLSHVLVQVVSPYLTTQGVGVGEQKSNRISIFFTSGGHSRSCTLCTPKFPKLLTQLWLAYSMWLAVEPPSPLQGHCLWSRSAWKKPYSLLLSVYVNSVSDLFHCLPKVAFPCSPIRSLHLPSAAAHYIGQSTVSATVSG